MNLDVIPYTRDSVHISQLKTLEGLHTVLYIASKGRKITSNEATSELIMLCDGISTHIQNKPRKIEKKQKKVIFAVLIAAHLVVLYYALFFFGFCVAAVTVATFTTISLVLT